MGKAEFDAAVNGVNSFTKQPSSKELLQFYGYFKQATEGKINTSRPAAWNVKDSSKWNAWASVSDLSTEEAQNEYVALYESKKAQYA